MYSYIGKRVLVAIPTLLIISIFVFSLQKLLPGDPVLALAGEDRDPQTIEYLREKYHLNDPVPVQYIRWVGSALQGDLGISLKTNQPVLKLSPPTQEADVTIRVPGAEGVNRQTVRYACGDKTVDVEYINAGPVAIARLTIGDDFVVAANVLSGSGAKYAGGRYIWWAKGDEATLYDLYRGDDADGVTCRPAP